MLKILTIFASVLLFCELCAVNSDNSGNIPKRFVVIVGVNSSPANSSLEPLNFADDDAAKYFVIMKRYSEKTYLLTTPDSDTQKRFPQISGYAVVPSKDNLKNYLSKIYNEIAEVKKKGFSTDLMFIYSGHGIFLDDKEGALTLSDGVISRTELYDYVIKKSPADFNHLIIDSCNSYYMVNQRGGKEEWKKQSTGVVRSDAVRNFFSGYDLSSYPNTGVVLSTSSEADSHEWNRIRSGVFSHELLSGIIGAADVNEDGKIEYSEIKAFLDAANLKVNDTKEKLSIFVKPPAQDQRRALFILDGVSQSAILKIPRNIKGRFFIENSLGTRYFDMNKTDEQSVSIMLVPEKLYYLVDNTNFLVYKIENASHGEIFFSRLKAEKEGVKSKGISDDRLKAALFAQPYGISFYKGVIAASDFISVSFEDNKAVSFDEKNEQTPSWLKITGWSMLSFGVVATVFGGVSHYMMNESKDDFDKDGNDEDSYLRWRGSTIAGYAAGGSIAVFGISMLIWDAVRKTDTVEKREAVYMFPVKDGFIAGFYGEW
ncbi:MAG TPA: caspase family protein [bacterium]|nr:caspase family protein [bacterium]